ncbi:hypothetical protein JIY74_29320 [Vibrio harveyi]|nr:hypothetical protein [Vibrio harveyi]
MKKLLLPIIGSLIIGSTITGGTVYAVKTIRHNAEVERIRTLFQNEAKSAQQLIDLVNQHLQSIKEQNRIIKGELDRINTQSNSILTNAKKVYEEAVKLTTYTVNDHEEKNVTYYLAYYDVQNKQIVATMDSTTKLQDKQEAIPATLEDLLANDKGIKVEHLVDGQLKTETLTKNRFNAKEFTTLHKVDVTRKIIEDVLKKAHQGGEKLIKFFQDKLNELTKLKKDLETIDVEDFVNLLGKLEKGIDKET